MPYESHISSISIIHIGLVIQINLYLTLEDILMFPKLWVHPSLLLLCMNEWVRDGRQRIWKLFLDCGLQGL